MKSPIDWRFETLENAVDCVFENCRTFWKNVVDDAFESDAHFVSKANITYTN